MEALVVELYEQIRVVAQAEEWVHELAGVYLVGLEPLELETERS